MDSLTRVAHARREIGLALGEQPTSKGYPPSVISLIPSLIERTGSGAAGKGTITSFIQFLQMETIKMIQLLTQQELF